MALVLICLCNIASQLWLWCIIVAILIFGLDIYNKTNKTVRCLINSKDKNAGNCIYWVTLQCDTDFISQTMCKCVTTSEKKLCLINVWEISGWWRSTFSEKPNENNLNQSNDRCTEKQTNDSADIDDKIKSIEWDISNQSKCWLILNYDNNSCILFHMVWCPI